MSLLDDPQIGSVIFDKTSPNASRAEALQRNQSEIFELIACRTKMELILARIAQMVEENISGARVGIFVVEDGRLQAGRRTPHTRAPSRQPSSAARAASGSEPYGRHS